MFFLYIDLGRHFSFFQEGGQNVDRLLRGGGQNMKKQNIVCNNTKNHNFP